MRKFIISIAASAAALTVATPAAAQWAQPQGYGYNQNYGQARSLQARIDNLQRQIARLDRRDIISNREARSLRSQSIQLERQLRYSARNGLNRAERNAIQRRIAQLEWRIRAESRDGNRHGSNDGRWQRDHRDNDHDGRDSDHDGRDRDRN